ncbi:MAG: fumarylacetoacetate hydrolase family protein [Deltaproteobacteria bacterium]|nr:fumarylacetoacetate hydrolase family protein [Deltaproteobacteria bacterium]
MKIIKFERNKQPMNGILEGDEVFNLIGNIIGNFEKGDRLCGIDDIRLRPPIKPGTVLGVGSNYYGLFDHMDIKMPKEPSIFLKAASCVIGHEEDIVLPGYSDDVRFEGELAVVIKKHAEYVSEENAMDYVLGFLCANDLTVYDITDQFPTRNKCFYTSCPLGPCITTGIDSNNLNIQTRLNGEIVSEGSTKEMVFSIGQLINYITGFMSLEPLDVILTGTPSRGQKLSPGDIVEIEIEGIGILRNKAT